jgi:hypothetical protein
MEYIPKTRRVPIRWGPTTTWSTGVDCNTNSANHSGTGLDQLHTSARKQARHKVEVRGDLNLGRMGHENDNTGNRYGPDRRRNV